MCSQPSSYSRCPESIIIIELTPKRNKTTRFGNSYKTPFAQAKMSSDPTSNLDNQFATDITKTTHKEEYPSISTTRPELSQAGRIVLITGGGAGIGFFTAKAFIRANAAIILIVSRRPEVLPQARLDLQKKVKHLEKPAIVVHGVCDAADSQSVAGLWDKLGE